MIAGGGGGGGYGMGGGGYGKRILSSLSFVEWRNDEILIATCNWFLVIYKGIDWHSNF